MMRPAAWAIGPSDTPNASDPGYLCLLEMRHIRDVARGPLLPHIHVCSVHIFACLYMSTHLHVHMDISKGSNEHTEGGGISVHQVIH